MIPEKQAADLPGYRKKSFLLYYNGGEIWFGHLDGMYGYEDPVLKKPDSDIPLFTKPSSTSFICFVFHETIVTDSIFLAVKNAVVGSGKQFSGIAFCGENGFGLSGGERQRISIARALLRKTPVLLVDEATASLDTETSYEVLDAILKLDGYTRMIITHDLDEGILRRCSGLFALKNGRVTEQGSFDELMDKKRILLFAVHRISKVI